MATTSTEPVAPAAVPGGQVSPWTPEQKALRKSMEQYFEPLSAGAVSCAPAMFTVNGVTDAVWVPSPPMVTIVKLSVVAPAGAALIAALLGTY